MTREEALHLIDKKRKFDEIGSVISKNMLEPGTIVTLEMFFDAERHYKEYIVVRWPNGGFEAANAECNSLSADLRQLGQMVDGGFYGQCDAYEEARDGSTPLVAL